MAKEYTMEDIESAVTPKQRFAIKFMYVKKLRSQIYIAKALGISKSHVAAYLKLMGLSRDNGNATKRARSGKRQRQRIGFAMSAFCKTGQRDFIHNLVEAKEERGKKDAGSS